MRWSRLEFPIKGKPSWPGTGRRVKRRLLVLSGSAVAAPKSVRRFAAKGWKNTFEQKQDYRSIRFFLVVRFNVF